MSAGLFAIHPSYTSVGRAWLLRAAAIWLLQFQLLLSGQQWTQGANSLSALSPINVGVGTGSPGMRLDVASTGAGLWCKHDQGRR